MPNSLQAHGLQPTRLLCPEDFPGKNAGVGCKFLLQGIFSSQGSNSCLLHWQVDFLPWGHQGSLDPLSAESKKRYYRWTYLQNRKRLTSLEKELTVARREGLGEGMDGEFGTEKYTLLYLKWITNKVQPFDSWFYCTELYMQTWQTGWEESWWKNRRMGHVWLSPSGVHLILSQQC